MDNDNTLFNLIRDLMIFFVKENYKAYLNENNITHIKDDNMLNVITKLYHEKKDGIKGFVSSSLKDILKDKYPSQLIINNILFDILSDEEVCINTLHNQIKKYQNENNS
tara:strand:+ start:578 stop:904 length:327 start_codon:yes stop_codon:yes gene_type:complete